MLIFAPTNADMAKLVDVPDLGSGALRRGGSSPFARTTEKNNRLALPEKDKQAVFVNFKQLVLEPELFRSSSSALISSNFKFRI